MSTRHTTVGQLTADDLGKRVEGDGWVIEELHVVSHFGGAYDTPLYRPAGPDWTGSLPRMITYDTPCIVTDPPRPNLSIRHIVILMSRVVCGRASMVRGCRWNWVRLIGSI